MLNNLVVPVDRHRHCERGACNAEGLLCRGVFDPIIRSGDGQLAGGGVEQRVLANQEWLDHVEQAHRGKLRMHA